MAGSQRILLVGAFLSCLAAPVGAQQLHTQLVASGLIHPVAFVQDPTDPNVQFVVEQGGHIRTLVAGTVQDADFLDISDVISSNREGGLLGLAFAPDYDSSGRFFINFTDANDNTVIARFTRAQGDALRAEPASRVDLVWPDGNAFISQPYCCHYGGNLAFGPDRYLYVAIGDGGAWDDPENNAQNPQSLLGKVLRLDVSVPDDDPRGYAIPPDNPFVGQDDVLAEIWDAGLRNPWRYSFDDPRLGGTGALIIGDVGQDAWEEFDYEPRGAGGRNYGWRNREGANDYIGTLAPWFEPLTDPTFQYPHDGGRAIIGGYVYRGQALDPSFLGRYFFGDFMTGQLWSIGLDIDPATGEAAAGDLHEHTGSADPGALNFFTSFGQDSAGELYVTSWWNGTVHRLVPGLPPPPPEVLVTIDTPASGAVDQPFVVAGWALDRLATTDSGVDYVEVWATRVDGTQSSFLVGRGSLVQRPDVAGVFGPQFGRSGYSLAIRGLAAGSYEIGVYAHSTTTQKFEASGSVLVDVGSDTRLSIDEPSNSATVDAQFTVAGWALDVSAPSGVGVDAVHVWAVPSNGDAPIWVGAAAYGGARPDVAAVYGSQFTNVAFSIPVSNLPAGTYRLMVYAHSSVTSTFTGQGIDITIGSSEPSMWVDIPAPESVESGPFDVAGWALDQAAQTGVGVDFVDVWAVPGDPNGSAIFIGRANTGGSRPDVGAAFGAQFSNSAFDLRVSGLGPGTYQLVVYAHSTVTGTFNQARVLRVIVSG